MERPISVVTPRLALSLALTFAGIGCTAADPAKQGPTAPRAEQESAPAPAAAEEELAPAPAPAEPIVDFAPVEKPSLEALPPPVGDVDPLAQLPGEADRFTDAANKPKALLAVKSGTMFGEWEWVEVEGAVCRDGSPTGYYIKRSSTSDNLMIFLNGGGVCYDDFFCAINPANVDQSLPGESLLAAVLDISVGVILPQRQVPPNNGIFAADSRNPVGNWNMVYVPYCTGDVHAGTKPNAPVPTAAAVGPQQFVGYNNIGLFLEDFGPDFMDAPKVLLTGSSAGGFGTLLNFDRTQTFFANSKVSAVTDSGIPFTDAYLEPCLQKKWRSLWGLDAVLPKDCKGCFNADGGGLAKGLGEYIFKEKYKDRMLGGGVSTKQDEIIKLFFSSGLNNCTNSALIESIPLFLGLSAYPQTRYPSGLKDFIDNVAGRQKIGSFIMEGSTHQHLFRDRFYTSVDWFGTSIASWLGNVLADRPQHVGSL